MPNPNSNKEDWQKIWNERISGLEAVLGKSDSMVYHAVMPFCLGGFADVLAFPNYRGGIAFVTSELTGEDVGQIANNLGNYELILCAKEKCNWAPNLISKLARYTCDRQLNSNATMDMGIFKDSQIKAFIFSQPEKPADGFEFMGSRYGLLLCLGITTNELKYAHDNGSEALLAALKEHQIFPFTDLTRSSIF